jgi:type II secretory pathway pseudopilin PulG
MKQTASRLPRRVVAASLLLIALLAGMPFVAARVISTRRLDAARLQTAALAQRLAMAIDRDARRANVLTGAGSTPQFADGSAWAQQTTAPLALLLDVRDSIGQADPWRNAYLVNAGARDSVWVVSAGPNGIVETPFEAAGGLRGDDVGARIW